MDERHFEVALSREESYAFSVRFDDPHLGPLTVDEAPPLGTGTGPNPTRVLGTAIGHCLASSLLFCLGKARVDVRGLDVRVHGRVTRNEQGRYRVSDIRVSLAPTVGDADRERLRRCQDLFEDFCIVCASLRRGFPIHVNVEPATEPRGPGGSP